MKLYVWQSQYPYADHDTPEEAIAAVEARGHGSVVQFRLDPNLPNCLPEYVHRSLAMWTYEDGKWWSVYIWDGTGGRMREERPHAR